MLCAVPVPCREPGQTPNIPVCWKHAEPTTNERAKMQVQLAPLPIFAPRIMLDASALVGYIQHTLMQSMSYPPLASNAAPPRQPAPLQKLAVRNLHIQLGLATLNTMNLRKTLQVLDAFQTMKTSGVGSRGSRKINHLTAHIIQ